MIHYRAHSDPRSSHQQIARIVRELNCGPVLDVGAAQGIIGELLKDSGLVIDAVEPNPAWAEAAKQIYQTVYPTTIEQASLPQAHYRVVVCGDVLEHTVDPAGVLRHLRKCATDDAVFIISVPNVAHLAVRLTLLFGAFPKMERGILDRTHLHFFTRDTASQMLRDAGLQITRTSGTPVPLNTYWANGSTHWLVKLLMNCQRPAVALLPRLFAMQWVFVARPAPSGSA